MVLGVSTMSHTRVLLTVFATLALALMAGPVFARGGHWGGGGFHGGGGGGYHGGGGGFHGGGWGGGHATFSGGGRSWGGGFSRGAQPSYSAHSERAPQSGWHASSQGDRGRNSWGGGSWGHSSWGEHAIHSQSLGSRGSGSGWSPSGRTASDIWFSRPEWSSSGGTQTDHGFHGTSAGANGLHSLSTTGQGSTGFHGHSVIGQSSTGLHGHSVTGQDLRGSHFTINGSPAHFPASPRSVNGYLTAPVKSFVHGMRGTMTRDHKTGYWTVRHHGHTFRFREGHRRAYYDGHQFYLGVAPYFYDGFLYCPIDPFVDYFDLGFGFYPYDYAWGYPYAYAYPVPVPTTTTTTAPQTGTISQDLAISLATRYMEGIGQYPDRLVNVTAHQNTAPANAYWDAIAAGQQPVAKAPMRPCWVVEYQYRSASGKAEWKQVFVDLESGDIIGGSQS